MRAWMLRGLRTGIVATKYPRTRPDTASRTVPRIDPTLLQRADCVRLAEVCPTAALSCLAEPAETKLVLDYGKCICCGLCAEGVSAAVTMSHDFELAAHDRRDLRTEYVFREADRGQ